MTRSSPTALPTPLTVYYDGACSVCSREIRFYAARSPHLELVDISAEEFQARQHGRDQEDFMARLHVRDAAGQWHLGVDGFRAIWLTMPGRAYHWLARLLDWPVLRQLAEWGYRLFARYRHLLPRRGSACDSDSCQISERRPRQD